MLGVVAMIAIVHALPTGEQAAAAPEAVDVSPDETLGASESAWGWGGYGRGYGGWGGWGGYGRGWGGYGGWGGGYGRGWGGYGRGWGGWGHYG